MENIRGLKQHLNDDKNIVDYNREQLEYLQKPIGKAIYKSEDITDADTKAHWSDRIKCNVCGKEFTRSSRTKHNKTQHHRTYEQLNRKLVEFLVLR